MPIKKRIKAELKNRAVIERCAREFGVVGDETRMKICYLLCRHPELSVGDIVRAVGVSISAVSHSLKKLKELKLVKRRRDKKRMFYCICPSPLTAYLKRSLNPART